jgi:hypothetical protein
LNRFFIKRCQVKQSDSDNYETFCLFYIDIFLSNTVFIIIVNFFNINNLPIANQIMREEGINAETVVPNKKRPVFVEVPLGVFAGKKGE